MRITKAVKPGMIVVKTKNGWLAPMDVKKGDRTPVGVWDGRTVHTHGWYPPRRKGEPEFSIAFKNRTTKVRK